MRLLLAACVAVVCLTAAPSALAAPEAKTETATSGSITATLTYTLEDHWTARDIRVAIARGGVPAAVARDGRVLAGCGRKCRGAAPIGGNEGSEASSLTFVDLAGDGEPELIVDLYTGGAHCCSLSAIYGWDSATSSYRQLIKFWGDPGYRLEALEGRGRDLVTADFRFAYTFCPYVCSAMPVIAYRYRAFRLFDVTDEHPALMRAQNRDLRASIRRAARHRDERFAIRGLLPAVCANLYRLGQGGACRRELDRALRRGWLSARGLANESYPTGRGYVRGVLRFLEKTGYR